MDLKNLFTLLLIAFGAVILLLVLNLITLMSLHGPSECHMTSLTSQVCEYR